MIEEGAADFHCQSETESFSPNASSNNHWSEDEDLLHAIDEMLSHSSLHAEALIDHQTILETATIPLQDLDVKEDAKDLQIKARESDVIEVPPYTELAELVAWLAGKGPHEAYLKRRAAKPKLF